jgi:hypothetical protein
MAAPPRASCFESARAQCRKDWRKRCLELTAIWLTLFRWLWCRIGEVQPGPNAIDIHRPGLVVKGMSTNPDALAGSINHLVDVDLQTAIRPG